MYDIHLSIDYIPLLFVHCLYVSGLRNISIVAVLKSISAVLLKSSILTCLMIEGKCIYGYSEVKKRLRDDQLR